MAILSGMAQTVDQLSPVSVPSTVPLGSARSCPRPRLMTLRFVFVVMKFLLMKRPQSNSSNSTFANDQAIVCELPA